MDGYFTIIEHPRSEYVFWWSQAALFVVLLVGVVIAYFELRTLSRQAKATLLLELDRRFEGPELSAVRRALQGIRDGAVIAVGQAHPAAGDGERATQIRAECLRVITDMRTHPPDNYSQLLSFMGFFETVGLMVRRRYVVIEEIDELFRGPILAIDLHFRDHIAQREQETGVPVGLYRHALNLADQVRLRASR